VQISTVIRARAAYAFKPRAAVVAMEPQPPAASMAKLTPAVDARGAPRRRPAMRSPLVRLMLEDGRDA
jgi:hypothetical protein